MTVFLTIMSVGFVILLVAFCLGEFSGHDGEVAHDTGSADGHGDVDHPQGGPNIFGLRFIAAFVTGFGGGGAIGRYLEFSYITSSLFGICLAIIVAGITYAIVCFLFKQQATSLVDTNDFVGKTAIVCTTIPKNGVGEVTFTMKGSTVTQLAHSKGGDLVPCGAVTIIREVTGSGVVVD